MLTLFFGQTDVFNIEAVSLGFLQKVLIGYNSTQPGTNELLYLPEIKLDDYSVIIHIYIHIYIYIYK